MLNESLAKRYSAALYASAKAQGPGGDKEQLRDLHTVWDLFNGHEPLRRCLTSPAVPRSAKKKILKAVFADSDLSVRTFNFLFVLIDKGRESYFNDIVECFKKQLCEDHGIVEAQVESAFELSEDTRSLIETSLKKITGKRVKMHYEVRPEIIGGLTINIDGRLYDGSIRRHLDNLRTRMTPKRV